MLKRESVEDRLESAKKRLIEAQEEFNVASKAHKEFDTIVNSTSICAYCWHDHDQVCSECYSFDSFSGRKLLIPTSDEAGKIHIIKDVQ